MDITYPFLFFSAAVLLFFFVLPVLLVLVALVLTGDVLFLLGDGMLDVDEDFWLSEEALRLQKHVKRIINILKILKSTRTLRDYKL